MRLIKNREKYLAKQSALKIFIISKTVSFFLLYSRLYHEFDPLPSTHLGLSFVGRTI